MRTRTKVIAFVAFAAAFAAWTFAFVSFRHSELSVFPQSHFEFYGLTDKAQGGSSTADLSVSDSTLDVEVNVRSGVAFPAVGIEFNLRSIDNRPTGLFDLSKFDSLEITFSTRRMHSVSLRVLTEDPVYSRSGRESLRVLTQDVQAGRAKAAVKVAVSAFRTAPWWLSAMGLEEDDGLTYLHRSAYLEIVGGSGVMRGIPDEISVSGIRLWGENRDFEKGMIAGAAFLALLLVAFIIYIRKCREKPLDCRRKNA